MTEILNMTREIQDIAADLLKKAKKTVAVAESCTGGLVSNLLTNIPGSSLYFMGGVVVYSNQSKIDLLKVPEKLIQEEGAVSRGCAVKMAETIRKIMHSDIGVAVTGIAGPEGGSAEKPVGSVYIAVNDGARSVCKLYRFSGNRLDIKLNASETAIRMVKELISGY